MQFKPRRHLPSPPLPLPLPLPSAFPSASADPSTVARTLQLPADGRAVELLLSGPTRLQAQEGQVWITRPGWPQDHWLQPGDSLDLAPAHRWRRLRLIASGVGDLQITLKLEPIV